MVPEDDGVLTEETYPPTVGDDVHYVLPDGRHPGEHRPAKIVKVWSDTCVQLVVFIDGSNDYEGCDKAPMQWRTSVVLDEAEKKPGTFHYVEFD